MFVGLFPYTDKNYVQKVLKPISGVDERNEKRKRIKIGITN